MPSRTSASAAEPLDQDLTTAASKAKPKAPAREKKLAARASETQSEQGTADPQESSKTQAKAAAKTVSVARKVSSGAKSFAPKLSDLKSSAPEPSLQEPSATVSTADLGEKARADVTQGASGLATKTAANRDVAAAFFAARQKMAPAKAPSAEQSNIDTVKGTVEVSDKKLKKTVDDENVVEHSAAAPAAPQTNPQPEVGSGALSSRAPVRPAAPSVANSAATKLAKPAGPKGQGFKTLEYIVYPAHGVGQIVAIEEQEVAGYKLELFVISFIKDKMILKVPLPKISSVGMRKLAEAPVVKRALDTLTGRARVKRTMWSRRAQEYEAKINSGDLVAIAEVVRDLYRSDAQPEQSYSERQLYEAALDRMAREIAVVQKLTDSEALKLIDDQLQKGPRRTKADEVEADDAEEAEDVPGVGEAA